MCGTQPDLRRAQVRRSLEALAVDDVDVGAGLLLKLGDPHLLEGGQGGQDEAADSDGALALRGGTILIFAEAGARTLIP